MTGILYDGFFEEKNLERLIVQGFQSNVVVYDSDQKVEGVSTRLVALMYLYAKQHLKFKPTFFIIPELFSDWMKTVYYSGERCELRGHLIYIDSRLNYSGSLNNHYVSVGGSFPGATSHLVLAMDEEDNIMLGAC